ncbi:MAG: DUF3298 domain-containing protein [Oscillospiraceae bacterium]|nr:DUF3298 domain-containing protein [Oscillospiraceae bacterium]
MGHEEPRLAEALTEERAWEAEGVTVLTASVALPRLAGNGGSAKRFNRYYRRFCRAYFTYCKQILLPEAADSLRASLAASTPWECARAELRYRVSHRAGAVWSVVCDARETVCGLPPFLIRRAEVWDVDAGLPMPLEEFFPPRTRCKKTLLRFAREETLRRVGNGAAFRDDWRAALRRAWNARNFYLTERGLCFFYPLCAVAGAKEGVVTFTVPYDAERGPFPPPEG